MCPSPQVLMASAIRGAVGVLGFLIGEPIATMIHPVLGKVAHAAATLFCMLALWGILLPIESAVTEPLARWMLNRIGGKRER